MSSRGDNGIYADVFCRELRENGAHIVGDCLYADAPTCNLYVLLCYELADSLNSFGRIKVSPYLCFANSKKQV